MLVAQSNHLLTILLALQHKVPHKSHNMMWPEDDPLIIYIGTKTN